MALIFATDLEHVLGKLQKAVVAVKQITQAVRFKTLLKRLEKTLKRIELVFYEGWRLSNRPEKETVIFISYLWKAIEIVLKCSSIKYRTMYQKNLVPRLKSQLKNLHSNKLIQLNSQLLRFFQIQVQANSIEIYGLTEDSVVSFSWDGYADKRGVHPGKLFNLQSIGSLVNLSSIKFDHVSVSSPIQRIFILPFLQELSFVMCEIGECASKNSVTESPYGLSNLRDLEFDYCYDMRELPSSLGNLRRLKNLSIANCHELDALPERLGNLLNLESLDLRCCTKLQELPESIGSLHNLRFLDLSNCLSISTLPEQIGELCGLKVFKMSNVHGLQELPESMNKLSGLEVICDEETSYKWVDFNVQKNIVEDDRFESFLKIKDRTDNILENLWKVLEKLNCN